MYHKVFQRHSASQSFFMLFLKMFHLAETFGSKEELIADGELIACMHIHRRFAYIHITGQMFVPDFLFQKRPIKSFLFIFIEVLEMFQIVKSLKSYRSEKKSHESKLGSSPKIRRLGEPTDRQFLLFHLCRLYSFRYNFGTGHFRWRRHLFVFCSLHRCCFQGKSSRASRMCCIALVFLMRTPACVPRKSPWRDGGRSASLGFSQARFQ